MPRGSQNKWMVQKRQRSFGFFGGLCVGQSLLEHLATSGLPDQPRCKNPVALGGKSKLRVDFVVASQALQCAIRPGAFTVLCKEASNWVNTLELLTQPARRVGAGGCQYQTGCKEWRFLHSGPLQKCFVGIRHTVLGRVKRAELSILEVAA